MSTILSEIVEHEPISPNMFMLISIHQRKTINNYDFKTGAHKLFRTKEMQCDFVYSLAMLQMQIVHFICFFREKSFFGWLRLDDIENFKINIKLKMRDASVWRLSLGPDYSTDVRWCRGRIRSCKYIYMNILTHQDTNKCFDYGFWRNFDIKKTPIKLTI